MLRVLDTHIKYTYDTRPMKKAIAVFAGAVISFTSVIGSAEAYNGFVSDIRYGEHPYEVRTRAENRRKDMAKQIKKFGYYTPDSEAYYHPLYARRKQLHPFYRKGGQTFFLDGRYSAWRGYQDPVRAHALSPDTYCSNFSYQRMQYRGPALAYQCF